MADAQRFVVAGREELDDVVDGGVRGGRREHRVAPVDGLPDRLDRGRRLAGTRRPVDQVDVVGREGPPDGLPLGIIERLVVPVVDGGSRRFRRRVGDRLGLLEADDHVPEVLAGDVSRRVRLGLEKGVQRLEHPLVGDVVDVEVEPDAVVEQPARRLRVEGDGHRVVGDLRHCPRRVVVPQRIPLGDHDEVADGEFGVGQGVAVPLRELDEVARQSLALVAAAHVEQGAALRLPLATREVANLALVALHLGLALEFDQPRPLVDVVPHRARLLVQRRHRHLRAADAVAVHGLDELLEGVRLEVEVDAGLLVVDVDLADAIGIDVRFAGERPDDVAGSLLRETANQHRRHSRAGVGPRVRSSQRSRRVSRRLRGSHTGSEFGI